MDLGLEGRLCAITGASRGIGLATARMLLGEGASVLMIARDPGRLGEAAGSCRDLAVADADVIELALDVTAGDAGERVLAAAGSRGVDVLVNNAGTARIRDLEDVPEEDWYAAWELNVMAPLRLMRTLVPPMAERGWGRVVNVSSSAGKRPSARMSEYSVAKAAQLSLSRLFADRYVKEGVLVNAIAPGAATSELWMAEGGLLDQTVADAGHDSRERALEAAAESRPAGRLAEPEEIAAAIAFLCSARASYVAGAAWSVDGGTVQVII